MGKNHILRLSGIATGAVLSASLLLITGSSGYVNPHTGIGFKSSSTEAFLKEQTMDSDLSKEVQESQAAPVSSQPETRASVESPAELVVSLVIDVAEPVDSEPVSQIAGAPVEVIEPIKSTPAPVAPAPETVTPKPVEAPKAPIAPAPAPVTVQPPAPTYDRSIYVGASGGQETVDRCIGPVLFHLPDPNFPVYIAEHDGCGGWERIGTLGTGQRVRMSGLVSGDYTVQEITTVKKKSSSNQIRFSKKHSVVLQTCIPQTDWMIVVGLD